jgi:glycosyltransferase involved in cell wall biosynthesis
MPFNKSLNILQTCFSRSWGGLEMQALEVTSQLSKRGHNVWLACNPNSRLSAEATKRQITVVPLDVEGYAHPMLLWRLRNFIRHKQIDIIHCQLSKDIATLVPAMRLSGERIPIILSKRVGSLVHKKDFFHRATYAHVDRVLAISEVIHQNVLDTTPVPPDRVITLHDAIDTGYFSLARVNRQRVRNEFGVGEDMIIVGMVGRFSPGKGHEEFLAAADILRKKYPAVHFLIVGEASYGEQRYEHKIRTMCLSLGLENVVTFTGYRSDIPGVMSAFDILAFPSHAESFGVVLIEAMAMERPVVSTNCDGVLDIVVDGETGIYVHPRKPMELAFALAKLIEYPAMRERMGKAGRKRVEELFDQKRQIEKIEELYFELTGLGRPTSAQPVGTFS